MPESKTSSSSVDPSSSGDRLWVTILAGGVGSRFWPVSTRERPKQLLPLASDQPLVVDALERARALAPGARIRLLTGEHLAEPLTAPLDRASGEALLLEARARGTAPALAFAAHHILREDPDAVLVSLHADHLIRPLDAFVETVRAAAEIADRDRFLVTIGARPDRPETGYGYIAAGEEVDTVEGVQGYRIDAFHEKPDADTVDRYLRDGFLWNTGIFVWRADVFLDEIRRHAPEIGRALPLLDVDQDDDDGGGRGAREGESGSEGPSGAEAFFDAVPKVSVDVAVMERTGRAAVVPASFDWDDVGAWHALARTHDGDDDGNVVIGPGLVSEGSGNIVYAEDGPVVLFGVDDLVAVRSGGVTLVTPRDRSADLKQLLDQLPPELRRD